MVRICTKWSNDRVNSWSVDHKIVVAVSYRMPLRYANTVQSIMDHEYL